MMKTGLALLGVLFLTATSVRAGDEWIETASGEDDGVRVWKKDVEGTSLVAFRGETEIDAPITKVAMVLRDTPRKKEWMADLIEARNIQVPSELERVEYTASATPWPLKNRDFLYRATVDVDRVKKTLTVRVKSIEDPSVPDAGERVRGTLEAETLLTSISNDTRTRIRIEVLADPKGVIPKWLVNLTQKNWPKKTLEAVRKQALKPDVFEHAQLKAYLFDGATREVALKAEVPAIAK